MLLVEDVDGIRKNVAADVIVERLGQGHTFVVCRRNDEVFRKSPVKNGWVGKRFGRIGVITARKRTA